MNVTAKRQPLDRSRVAGEIADVTLKLFEYCRAEDWSGYDPYDALNSKILSRLPVVNAKWPRLSFTQLLKRSPVNFRPLLRIPKTRNPKALGLFLIAALKLLRVGLIGDRKLPVQLASLIQASRSSNQYWCWGYSFPWQGRSIMVGRGEPNLVCTTFVAEALLDLFEETADSRYLTMAESSAQYLLNDLFWTDGNSVSSFAYPRPSVRTRVHNANFLAAAFLLRLYRHTKDERAQRIATEVALYSASCQRPDGSWPYGEESTQWWIDNFHTGYNLCSLRRIAEYGKTTRFDQNIDQGYRFYRQHFFREDGAPRYFHNRTYPIDVHCAAQSVITLLQFKDRDPSAVGLAQEVVSWTIRNLGCPSGYFYYRKGRWGTNKISYMRWAQAWMLVVLSTLLEYLRTPAPAGSCTAAK